MDSDKAAKQLIDLYLSNLQVRVVELGFNPVWSDWRNLDYRPEYNKFYLITKGEGWIKIGDQEYYPQPGQLALMPEGTLQSYSTINDKYYTKYWCHFTAKVGTLNLFDLIRLPWLLDVGQSADRPAAIFREMLRHSDEAGSFASLHINSCILRLIAFYLEHAEASRIRAAQSESATILHATLTYIDDNLHRNITVDELAELAYLHPNYFIRLIKKHLGVPPMQYVKNRRIELAKLLLSSTTLTLSEIGERVGIHDISYLSKTFKTSTGFSPTAYRLLSIQPPAAPGE